MPRYYFPSWDGDAFLPDEEGIEFENMEQARASAIGGLAEMARDVLPGSSGGRILRIQVLDGGAVPVLELRLTFEVDE